MRLLVLFRHSSAPCLARLSLCRQGPRTFRFLNKAASPPIRLYAIPRNVRVLLGLGVMGGVGLSVVKYFKSDRTSNCQSKSLTPHLSVPAAELSVHQFGAIQRLKLALRFTYLCCVFSPALTLYALSWLLGSATLAHFSWRYVLFVLQNTGPAFIKLGQWASTRRDLFPDDFCSTLSALHLRCHPHSWKQTVVLMEASFGPNWQETVCIEDHTPIGSGCVAQVYQGRLHHHGDDGDDGDMDSSDKKLTSTSDTLIAVKVLHPNIVERMEEDTCLMKYVASWVDYLYPDVYWVAFTECVDEFTVIMEKQLNMEREAQNLNKFRDYMINDMNIKFPIPIYPYVTRDVLVETFEHGDQISEYLDNPGGELQKKLAKVGVEAVLDMLFVHNFVHGDLHPGNILVQDSSITDPTLVLLDCGIATSLEPQDLENLLCVFTAIVKGEGWKVADLFLAEKQTCSTLKEYRRKVGDLVNAATQELNLKKVRVDTLFSDLFNVLIEHKVRIDPNFTSVMMAMMIIEGLGRSLDPNMDILTCARTCVLHRARQSLKQQAAQRLQNIL